MPTEKHPRCILQVQTVAINAGKVLGSVDVLTSHEPTSRLPTGECAVVELKAPQHTPATWEGHNRSSGVNAERAVAAKMIKMPLRTNSICSLDLAPYGGPVDIQPF